MELNLGKGFAIDAHLVVTGRGCIIGQSGSGKSYLVGVIVEELCKHRLPFVIIDTEGEYGSLKSEFEVIWVGSSKKADLPTDTPLRPLFRTSMERGVPVILDVSDIIEKQAYVYRALEVIYSLGEEERAPYLVVIEEADKFAPQIVKPRVNPVEELSVRGRKRGIGLLVATQRPANVSKNVLAQCSYGFVGRLSIENDLHAVGSLFESKKRIDKIPNLITGTFIPFGMPGKEELSVRKRLVQHVAETPELRENVESERVAVILQDLKKAKPESETKKIKDEIKSKTKAFEVVKENYSEDQIREIARGMLKKQFVLFGQEIEGVDSITKQYLQTVMCDIMIPTGGRGEYTNNYLILKGDSALRFTDKINFDRIGGKTIGLDSDEEKILSTIFVKGALDHSGILKATGIKSEALDRKITKLKRAHLVMEEKDKFKTKDFRKILQKSPVQTDTVNVNATDIIDYDEKLGANSRKLISNIFPGAQIRELKTVLIPIYRVTLRDGNRVRLFNIDGVFGKSIYF